MSDTVETGVDREFQIALGGDFHDLASAAVGYGLAPPEFGFNSLRQMMIGATFSVASTGMVRTPDGNAVAFRPSCVRRPRTTGVERNDFKIADDGLIAMCLT